MASRMSGFLAAFFVLACCSVHVLGSHPKCVEWNKELIAGNAAPLRLMCVYGCDEAKGLCPKVMEKGPEFGVVLASGFRWLESILRLDSGFDVFTGKNRTNLSSGSQEATIVRTDTLGMFYDFTTGSLDVSMAFLSFNINMGQVILLAVVFVCLMIHQSLVGEYHVAWKIILMLCMVFSIYIVGCWSMAFTFMLHCLCSLTRADRQYGNIIPISVVLLLGSAMAELEMVALVFGAIVFFGLFFVLAYFWAKGSKLTKTNDLSIGTGAAFAASIVVHFAGDMTVDSSHPLFALSAFVCASALPYSETGSIFFFFNGFGVSALITGSIFYGSTVHVGFKIVTLFVLFFSRIGVFLSVRAMMYARHFKKQNGYSSFSSALFAYSIDPFRVFSIMWNFKVSDGIIAFALAVGIWFLLMVVEIFAAFDVFIVRVGLWSYVYLTDGASGYIKVFNYVTCGASVECDDFESPGSLPDFSVTSINAFGQAAGKVVGAGIKATCGIIRAEGENFVAMTAAHVSNKFKVGDRLDMDFLCGSGSAVVVALEENPVLNAARDAAVEVVLRAEKREFRSKVKEVCDALADVNMTDMGFSDLHNVESMALFKHGDRVQPIPSWKVCDDMLTFTSRISKGDSGSVIMGSLADGSIVRVGVATHGRDGAANLASFKMQMPSPTSAYRAEEVDPGEGPAIVEEEEVASPEQAKINLVIGLINGRVHLSDPDGWRVRFEGLVGLPNSSEDEKKKRKSERRKFKSDLLSALLRMPAYADIGRGALKKLIDEHSGPYVFYHG